MTTPIQANPSTPVLGSMSFWPADGPSMLTHPPIRMDMRRPGRRETGRAERISVPIEDARAALDDGADLGLETSGFACQRIASAVRLDGLTSTGTW